eukprot:4185883-Pyramimonas_sp.AAC.1
MLIEGVMAELAGLGVHPGEDARALGAHLDARGRALLEPVLDVVPVDVVGLPGPSSDEARPDG